MPGPLPHNELHAAARQTMAVARKAKSPLLERVAVFAMIGSAISGIGVALLHRWHMLKKNMRDEQRDHERRRPEAASPPLEPPRKPGDDRSRARRQKEPPSTDAEAAHRQHAHGRYR